MKRELQMAIAATSGMTLFSYILSRIYNEKFLETVLLNQLIFPAQKEKKKHHVAGAGIHYAVGYLFSIIYHKVWTGTSFPSGIGTGAIMGFVNGVTGILGWYSVLSLHPHPPRIKPQKYYLQLLAAHVVFGVINSMVYRSTGTKVPGRNSNDT